MAKKKAKKETTHKDTKYRQLPRKDCECDYEGIMTPKEDQLRMRERGYNNKQLQVNSDMIFTHKDMKKHTKGYDELTGEIEKRGRPADNQDKIFLKTPEKDKSFAEIKKDKDKNDAKRRQAYNKKLYRDRLKTKWDRGW
jgi:inosine/xanthosine triphosphate pyrophosphatase family protein